MSTLNPSFHTFKPRTFVSPNKMQIDSDYKTFNRQCDYISTGNVYSNCQFSSYIRPYYAVVNGGYRGKPGEFLAFDIQKFGKHVPEELLHIIYNKTRTDSVILYQFRTFDNNDCADVFGYILTDSQYNELASSVICKVGQNYSKRLSALEECKNYVCNGHYAANKIK